MDNAKIKLHSI